MSMRNIDENPSSHTSAEAPAHSKDTVLMHTDWKGRDKDEMESASCRMENVQGGQRVLNNFKTRL